MALVMALIVIAVLTAVAMWRNWDVPMNAQIPILTVGLVLIVGAFSLSSQRDQADRFNEAAIQRDFDTRHLNWVHDDDLYRRCLDAAAERVAAVDKDRAYKIADAEDFSASLIALTNNNPDVVTFADNLEERRKRSIETLVPPLAAKVEQAKCKTLDPGGEPVQP